MPNLVILSLLVTEISAFIQTDKPKNLTNSFRLLIVDAELLNIQSLYKLDVVFGLWEPSTHYKPMLKVDIPFLIHFQWSKVKRFAWYSYFASHFVWVIIRKGRRMWCLEWKWKWEWGKGPVIYHLHNKVAEISGLIADDCTWLVFFFSTSTWTVIKYDQLAIWEQLRAQSL